MSRRCAFVSLVLVTLAAGCGRDDSSFASDADAICQRVVADSRLLFQTTGMARVSRDRAFSRIVRDRGAALVELREQTPPPPKRAQFQRMLTHFQKSQRLLRQGERLWGKSEEGPFLIVSASREGEKGHAVARTLGLDDCAEF